MRVSDRVQAAGAFFAPSDLVQFGAGAESIIQFMRRQYGTVDPSFEFFADEPKAGTRTRIGEPDAIARVLRELSPMTHVTPDDPPTILIHGTSDAVVPIEQSHRLAQRLGAAGVPVQLIERQDMAHAWPGWEADTARVAEWFDMHLHVAARPR